MSVVGTVQKLPRPDLKNLHKKWLYKHIVIALTLGITASTLFKFYSIDVKRKEIADFHKTYDPYADFERMRKLGLFSSCPPDEE